MFDTVGAAAYRNAVAHIEGPLRSGASDAPVVIAPDASVTIDWITREPLVVVSPLADLGNSHMVVTAVVKGATAGLFFSAADFQPWTPRGATVPLFLPAVDAALRTAKPFVLTLTATTATGNAAPAPIPAAQLTKLLEVRVIEGIMGRVAFLMTSEQQRLRRTSNTLSASKNVATATGSALDRIGADLGIPRFPDQLVYDATDSTLTSQTVVNGESDGSYQLRLSAFSAFVVPNGVGASALLASAGIPGVTFAETSTPFPVAIRVCAIGAATALANFYTHVRNTYLILLDLSSASDAIHHARFFSPSQLAAIDAQRARLVAGYTVPANAAVAPFLADALDLAYACRIALLGANPPKLTIVRASDSTAGSRYELGLGCDVAIIAQSQRSAMATAVAHATSSDPEVSGALSAMQAALSAGPADPQGSWFWSACGMQTIQQIDSNTLYLSTTAVGPLTIEGNANVPSGPMALSAVRRTPDSPNADALLAAAVVATQSAWVGAGHAAWTILSAADSATAWKAAVARPTTDPVGDAIAGAGLPAVTNPAATAAALVLLPSQMVITVHFAAADAKTILAHTATSIDVLRSLFSAAHAAGVSSMLVLTTSTDVYVVFGSVGLPLAGTNIGDRGSLAIRWSTVPLAGTAQLTAGSDASASVNGVAPALALVVAVSGARVGAHDPYETAVELPAKALIDLDQYELAMNTLIRVCPIGVRINTWDLRQQHVDLTNTKTATPVPAEIADSFRHYIRERYRGEGPPETT